MRIDNFLYNNPIRPEELERFRKNLKAGDCVWSEVGYIDLYGTKFFRTKRAKVKIIKKYPHVVVTRDMRTGKEHHTTYIKLLMLERKAQYGETAV